MAQHAPALRGGHALLLLQGSTEFFPAIVQAIDGAQREVRFETYIFDFTGTGTEVAYALERAARRGVSVMVVVDGFGSDPLALVWQQRFAAAGVDWRVFNRPGRLGLLWPGSWRRLHRKLCVVDGEMGFCGGINVLDDLHDPSYGALSAPRFDFSVQVTGPLLPAMHEAMDKVWRRLTPASGVSAAWLKDVLFSPRATFGRPSVAAPLHPLAAKLSRAALLLRDNLHNRRVIEKAYRRAIGQARSEIIIANAYFVPGRKMRQSLILAAQRGVNVRLLLQGRYEYFLQYYGARPVYAALLKAGVEIHEYAPSFLHAKVAVIDGRWATVGSSNLDPLSLLLAQEANLIMEDAVFAASLRDRLALAMKVAGKQLDATAFAHRSTGQRCREWIALMLMRVGLSLQGTKYL